MNITEWNDENFIPFGDRKRRQKILKEERESGRAMTDLHRERQKFFYLKCIEKLKEEKWTWTSFVDVDEYILPNGHVKSAHKIPETNNSTTIYAMLEIARTLNVSKMLSSPCIQMKRIMFGSKESERYQVQYLAPEGFNVSNLFTFRWRWHESYSGTPLGKCVLDVSRVNASAHLVMHEIKISRVIRSLCPKSTMFVSFNDSSFLVNHYVGSWEQWSFRSDPRSKLGWTRTRDVFDKRKVSFGQDDSAREWLKDFVARDGREVVSSLLEGAGLLARS